jgi:DNA methyltransferase 1-associated protein 1
MDVKDILGVSRPGGGGEGGPAKKQKKEVAPKMKRPEGMSREAFKLLSGTAPTVTSALLESFQKDEAAKKNKSKPKASTKGTVTWQYR